MSYNITITDVTNEIVVSEETNEIVVSPTETQLILSTDSITVPGETGPEGPQGDTGLTGPEGPPGTGDGLPGGTAGQVLKKIDNTDYNTVWASDVGSVVYTQDSQPASAVEGDRWFNTLTGQLTTYASGAWQSNVLDGQNF